ncbi:ParB/RepB/Spo0J family partition protein [Streptomyces avermitilis]|uniref:ParB/RepB/Spo0J family partition protein n=1 Tax=Streptomyces avermitilis TaxID=33903 RepID=UPI00340C0BF8
MHQPEAGTLDPAPYESKILETDTSAPAEVNGPRITSVPVSVLLPGESPRSQGVDHEHVARLADLDVPLPPILVRRSDMRVVDGMHRLLAALIRGQETIDVAFFEGSAEDAFLHGVEANVAHGLPLSLADRRAAASRIITSHPHMSDRAIARASGLGAKAVASIRRRSTGAEQRLNARVGRDGRIRPLSCVEGRWRAAEVMAENPKASLRQVARIAGISPATASDVRKRIQAGEPPAAVLPQAAAILEASAPATTDIAPAGDARVSPSAHDGHQSHGRRVWPTQPNSNLVLEKLLRDPSLRLKEEGRRLLRLLQQNALAEWSGLSAAVPPHCETLVGSLARQYAHSWLEFAQHLEERDRSDPQRAIS